MPLLRIDRYETIGHGQEIGYADWMGGPTISNVRNTRVIGKSGRDTGLRRAARVTGEPLSWFSLPAVITYKGKRVKGCLSSNDGVWEFKVTDDITILSDTYTYKIPAHWLSAIINGDETSFDYYDDKGDYDAYLRFTKDNLENAIIECPDDFEPYFSTYHDAIVYGVLACDVVDCEVAYIC